MALIVSHLRAVLFKFGCLWPSVGEGVEVYVDTETMQRLKTVEYVDDSAVVGGIRHIEGDYMKCQCVNVESC